MKLNVFYRAARVNGVDGYYVSTEYEDERFFFGSLDQIKRLVDKQNKFNWIEMKQEGK